MTMKNITKAGLNSFISTKIKGNREELLLRVETAINTKIDPILAVYVETKKVETLASKFVDEAEIAMEKYALSIDNWAFKRIIQDMNSKYVSLGLKIKQSIKGEVRDRVKHTEDAYDLGNVELNQAVAELQNEMKPIYKNINDLDTLLRELERAIKNESSASRAYKALLAFGVDMNGYEEADSYLPAIVKLSVDVCILNGNCEEKIA